MWQKVSLELSIKSFDLIIKSLHMSDGKSEGNHSFATRGEAIVGDDIHHDLSGHWKHKPHVSDGRQLWPQSVALSMG